MYVFKKPVFHKGRILSQEILETMRDTVWDFPWVQYMELTDGIIKPCTIQITEQELIIGKGLLKWQDRLYTMMEPIHVPYEATEQWRGLKIHFFPENPSKDFILFQTEILLDENTIVQKEDEMELCRFKLKAGSRLRQDYVDFHDLDTEFDTLNILHVPYAGVEKKTVSPFVTRYFAKEAYPLTVNMPFDNAFAGLCLNSRTPIDRELILGYIRARLGREDADLPNNEIYRCLSVILADIHKGIAVDGYNRRQHNRKILVE